LCSFQMNLDTKALKGTSIHMSEYHHDLDFNEHSLED